MPAKELFIKYNSNWSGISNSNRYRLNNGVFSQYNSGTWVDMYGQWGVSFDSTALSTLMTPAPLKGLIENSVATENGKRVVRTDRRLDERTLTLGFNITAKTKADFMDRYAALCSQILAVGKLDICTVYQPTVVYHLDYLSCQGFGEYQRELGKFSLRVVEPNPGNRTDA